MERILTYLSTVFLLALCGCLARPIPIDMKSLEAAVLKEREDMIERRTANHFDATGYQSFTGMAKDVVDGDTLVVTIDGQHTVIGLYGVEAPEYIENTPDLTQPFGKEAKDFVASIVQDRPITMIKIGDDLYGRAFAAIVMVDGQSLNLLLAKAGYGWVHGLDNCFYDICNEWESARWAARNMKYGLWGGENIIDPARWRTIHANRKPIYLKALAGVVVIGGMFTGVQF